MSKRLSHAEMAASRTEIKVLGAVPYPVKIRQSWRDQMIASLPALHQHPNALCYRRLAEYLLYSRFREEETGRIVVPSQIIAHCADAKIGQCGWRAIDVLEAFSQDVWPLTIYEYVPLQTARTVDFDVPDAVIAIDTLSGENDDLVWFVSGLPVSPSSRRKSAARYDEGIHALADGVDENHPAFGLMQYLNTQSQRALGDRVRANWHRLEAMYEEACENSHIAWTWKRWLRHTLDALQDWCKLIYAPSEGTARITAQGTTIHSLPRDFRKAALSGAVEMDIRSSQLAIVAQLWDLPLVTHFLQARKSIWAELIERLRVDESAKPALKSALYACCFGMGKAKLFERLSRGHKEVAGLGDKAAQAFLRHPLIREVLRGRGQRMKQVLAAGGVVDAFGRWIELGRESPAHALLAVEAQSWELRLMLPVYEVARAIEGASILSWLHDGVVVYHRNQSEDRFATRCKQAFDDNAANQGFATDLEISRL